MARTSPHRSFLRDNARWLGAGFGLSFCSSFGQTFFISLFAGELQALTGLTDGGWGALYTVATLASAATIYRIGGLADRMRLERLAVAVLAVYALTAFAMGILGWLGGPGLASVVLLGVAVYLLRLCGQGMMGHIAATAMGRWFRAHRGRAVAIAGLGFSVGEAVLPAAVVAAVAAVGWRETWLGVALVLALLALPALGWALSEARAPRGLASADEATGMGGRHWRRSEALRHWTFWALLPAVLTGPFIGTVVFFHQVHIADVKGWTLAEMALAYPAYAGLTVASALAGGALVDRLGPRRLLPVFLLPMALGTAVIGPAESSLAWVAALALFGLTQGMAQTIWGALWPELYGTRWLGEVRAVSMTAMIFATAAGPGLTGILIDEGITLPQQAGAMGLWCLAVAAVGLRVSAAIAATEKAPAAG